MLLLIVVIFVMLFVYELNVFSLLLGMGGHNLSRFELNINFCKLSL